MLFAGATSAQARVSGTSGRLLVKTGSPTENDPFATFSPDGSGRVTLPNVPGDEQSGRFSPDGAKIVFDQQTRFVFNYDIYVMNLASGATTNLTNGVAREAGPAWSPDGSRIAFARETPGDLFDVWIMRADGTGRINLTPGDPANAGGPVWSPDGSQLAFSSGSGGQPAVEVMRPDGTGRHVVVTGRYATDWTPDGRRLLLVTPFDEDADIEVVNTDGTGLTKITSGPSYDRDAVASPDGRQIAFTRTYSDFTDTDVYVANVDGGDPHVVVGGASRDSVTDWETVDPDRDRDGTPDATDSFPDDPDESADGDADGLGDNGDPDTTNSAIQGLPDAAFSSRGHRQTFASRLDAIEAMIKSGDLAAARQSLQNLRRKLDGCGTTPDGDDWITDCAVQPQIRAVVDRLLLSLA